MILEEGGKSKPKQQMYNQHISLEALRVWNRGEENCESYK